nr:hypothetical protein CFP56_34674 [Quercus suber]
MSNNYISTPKDEGVDFIWSEPDHESKRGATRGGMNAKVHESMPTGQLYHHIALCRSEVHEYSSVSEQAVTATKDENTQLSHYATIKAREPTGWGDKSPGSLSGDKKNDVAQSYNVSSSATVIDNTSYMLENEAETDNKVKEAGT